MSTSHYGGSIINAHRIVTIPWMVCLLLSPAPFVLASAPQEANELEDAARPWQVQSFFDDAKLDDRNIIFMDSAEDGVVWLAVSDGLYRYDGYSWRRFTTSHGLPSNYVRCVLVASDGVIWVGTDRGAGVFNGERFESRGLEGELAGPSIRRIVEDPDGTLWFCCDQWPDVEVSAGLTRMRNGEFKTWTSEDGLPSNYVSDYFRDSTGQQFVLTNKGLAQFVERGFRQPLRDSGLWQSDTYVWSMVESPRHGLLVATDRHFYQFKEGVWKRFENPTQALRQPRLLSTSDGEILTCTHGRGPYFMQWTGNGFGVVSRRLVGVVGGVEVLVEDPFGGVWAGGFERLLRWERSDSEWSVRRGNGIPRLKDGDGGVWFDTDHGLIRMDRGAAAEVADVSVPIVRDGAGGVWMQSNDGLAHWIRGKLTRHRSQDTGLVEPKIAGLDGNGVLWATGLNAEGRLAASAFGGTRWVATELPRMLETTCICRARPDPSSGVWCVLGNDQQPPFHLIKVDADGAHETPLPNAVQITDPPKVVTNRDGDIWIGGFFGLRALDETGQDPDWVPVKTPSRSVSQLYSFGDQIWLSCEGHLGGQGALMRFRDGKWESFPNHKGRLVGRDGNAQLFVSSHRRLELIDIEDGRFQAAITTPFETQCDVVVAGNEGEYWVGVGKRAYRYRPNEFPPETEIVSGSDKLHAGEDLVLRVRGVERFKQTDQERNFLISMRLNEQPWTDLEPLHGEIRIPGLGSGKHALQLRVQNAAGRIDATPVRFDLRVTPVPILERPWFPPVAIGLFAMILALAFVASVGWTKVRFMARGLEDEVTQKTSKLSASEHKYRVLFEQSRDAVCLFGSDGVLQDCNQEAIDHLGLSRRQRHSIAELFVSSEDETRFQRELAIQGFLRGMRVRLRGASGEPFDALLSANVRTDAANMNDGYQVIVRDISPLVRLQERLRETQKMEAIGRMAGGIAHDFNNFLAVIVYAAEFIKIKSNDDAEVAKGIGMVLDAADRAKVLTSQIQSFSRAPYTDMKILETREVIYTACEMLKGIVPANVELIVDMDDDLGQVRGDAHQLEQVIINLVVNACHAMPNGGSLTIQGGNVDLQEPNATSVGVAAPGRYVRLRVTDTGTGMAAEIAERVFDPFFTTKPPGQGTGLGLAIVYGIVQQFNGQIKFESRVGQGTRFDVYLPIRAAASEAIEERPTPLSMRGDETILLVEDQETVRDLVKDSLERCGYAVHTAISGLDAKHMLERNDEGIAMVISDVVMPGLNGLELVRWLESHRPDVATLLISGYPQPNVSEPVTDELESAFLAKPFHPSTLTARVREILDASASKP